MEQNWTERLFFKKSKQVTLDQHDKRIVPIGAIIKKYAVETENRKENMPQWKLQKLDENGLKWNKEFMKMNNNH